MPLRRLPLKPAPLSVAGGGAVAVVADPTLTSRSQELALRGRAKIRHIDSDDLSGRGCGCGQVNSHAARGALLIENGPDSSVEEQPVVAEPTQAHDFVAGQHHERDHFDHRIRAARAVGVV